MAGNNRNKEQRIKVKLNLTLCPNSCLEDNKIQGVVSITSESDVQIKGVLLTVSGDLWTEITPERNGRHKYTSNVFVQSSYILGKDSGSTLSAVLHQGQHSLPFSICLPPHLPSSFEGKYGALGYKITAQIQTSGESSNSETFKSSHALVVKRFLDLSDGTAYGNLISFPARLERPVKTLRKTLIHNNQYLKFDFKLQKTGFATGESIPFVMDVYNPDLVTIPVMSVALVKKTVYGDLKFYSDVYEDLGEVSTGVDNRKLRLTWIGSLPVPTDATCTHSVVRKKKPIFQHRYLLRVKLVPSSGICITGDMSIIVGTTKYDCRSSRQSDHCSRSVVKGDMGPRGDWQFKRQSSMPPSYSQILHASERRASLETLPPPYEEAMAMASKAMAKESRHLIG